MIDVPEAQMLSADQALRIAQADAIKVYRDLRAYRIRLELEQEGWHVNYELKDPKLKGGAHYIIDRLMGVITFKNYEQ